MFESIPPDFPPLTLTNFAEMNQEDILCIVRTVNEINIANDQFNIAR